jgi:Reverse transcriptase (RNA-dependent DNA polymerase)
LESLGFEALVTDSCLFINRQDGILVVTYVDDFLAVGPKGEALDAFRYELRSKWTIEELGDAEYFLGVRIVRDRENNKLYLCQDAYIDKILVRYGMTNSKPVETPMASGALELMVPFDGTASKKDIEEYGSIVGSLNYLACQTRCDIAYTVSVLSRFLTNPSLAHIKAAKRVLQYLKGTKYLSIVYGGDVNNDELMKLHGFFDSDFAGDLHQRKSHSGSVFKLAGGVVSAVSKRQSVVAQSSTEAEYYSGAKAGQESEYLRQVLNEMGYKGEDA